MFFLFIWHIKDFSRPPFVAELGDYDEELDAHHLESKQYVPNQEYLDHKILRFHKKHR